jgi:hypothetical protein
MEVKDWILAGILNAGHGASDVGVDAGVRTGGRLELRVERFQVWEIVSVMAGEERVNGRQVPYRDKR